LTFSLGGSQTINVTPALLALTLNSGTAVTNQATTTLNLNSALTASNPSGDGGALHLQSQGTLNLNADINTDNGNLTLQGAIINTVANLNLNSGAGSTAI
jgi:hypothetical protein